MLTAEMDAAQERGRRMAQERAAAQLISAVHAMPAPEPYEEIIEILPPMAQPPLPKPIDELAEAERYWSERKASERIASAVTDEGGTEERAKQNPVPSPALQAAPATQAQEPTKASGSDARLLGRMVHRESHWEAYEGRLAAAQTAIDRMEGNPGMSLADVLLRPGQYVLANNDHGCADCLEAAEAALGGARAIPGYMVYHFRMTASTADWHAPYIKHIGIHAFYGWERPCGNEDKANNGVE